MGFAVCTFYMMETLVGIILAIPLTVYYIILFSLFGLAKLIIPRGLKDVSSDTVLITGGAHGIGKEMALEYGRLGARVLIIDINEAAVTNTIAALHDKGVKVHGFICDVTKRDKIFGLAEKIKKEIGPVTILVNNAGVLSAQLMIESREDQIRQAFEVNVISHFWSIQAFLPEMLSRNSGHIVAMGSLAGIFGCTNGTVYCASKFAVRGMMESLQRELKAMRSAVKVTVVCPFFVDTGFCKNPKTGILKLLKPKSVAKTAVHAQRQNKEMVTIPFHLLHLYNLSHLIPHFIVEWAIRVSGVGFGSDNGTSLKLPVISTSNP